MTPRDLDRIEATFAAIFARLEELEHGQEDHHARIAAMEAKPSTTGPPTNEARITATPSNPWREGLHNLFGPRLPPTKGSSMTHVQPALFAAAQTQPTSDDYYTPAWLFERMGITFDVDVASPPGGLSWIPAARYFTKEDDGLAQEWTGRVWMNPPFSKPAPWIDKFIAHGNGICLVPSGRARWYIDLWAKADGICTPGRFSFAAGRIDASGKLNGDIRFPVNVAAFGPECVEAISRIGVVRVVA